MDNDTIKCITTIDQRASDHWKFMQLLDKKIETLDAIHKNKFDQLRTYVKGLNILTLLGFIALLIMNVLQLS
jgi:hypothetical protein